MGRLGRFAFAVAGVLLGILALLEFVQHLDWWYGDVLGLVLAIGTFACFRSARTPPDRVA